MWSITGGTNHTWLSIDPMTGILSGTPTALGPVSIDIHIEEPTMPSNFADRTYNFNVVAQTFFEDFEGACPNGWTLVGQWQCGAPSIVGPPSAFSGTQCLGTNLSGGYISGISFGQWTADSPPIMLTGANPSVQFQTWMDAEPGWDGFNLRVSTDNGMTFQLVNTVMPSYNLFPNAAPDPIWSDFSAMLGWQPYTADLTPYSGQTVILRFDFFSDLSVDGFPGIYIDDFAILE